MSEARLELGSAWEAEPLTGPMIIAVPDDSEKYDVTEDAAKDRYAEIARLARDELESRDLAAAIRRAESSLSATAPATPLLSHREEEVLALLADGLGAAEIARILVINEPTAKTHITLIYQKLSVPGRAEALAAAERLGLLDLSFPSR